MTADEAGWGFIFVSERGDPKEIMRKCLDNSIVYDNDEGFVPSRDRQARLWEAEEGPILYVQYPCLL